MIIVDADAAASDLKLYLQKVHDGETVFISIDSQPVAELRATPASPAGPRPIGLGAGEFRVPDDFDAPLPKEALAPFLGE